ncbi:helix-turn-helix domain-containing protein [Actinokineospora auranticolor]|uniref:AcrR family transcriptional regulator n=1 Tax=Actinokineospora auranticolor TaxID=155976 RepID=A0A2S6H1A4_9PSEU|nr:TetR/AcrR family transcriptional regulator [Actinokineospora auranticolor]PPK71269.1 AcrR family transcriptional regulator [Actinokineospora auranticolor]
MTTQRPLRADAERSVRAILEAAERVLSRDPAASMEQIAEAAGVARATVHRRFTTRQALLDAMATDVVRQLDALIDEARPETAPPLVALHRITAGVLRVKLAWPFAMAWSMDPTSPLAEGQARIATRCDALLLRAQADGHLPPNTDLPWTRRVYYALLGEAAHTPTDIPDPDTLATLVLNTLLHGVGPRT